MMLPPCACGAPVEYAGIGVYPKRCPVCRRAEHHRRSEASRLVRMQRDPTRHQLLQRLAYRRKSQRRYAAERQYAVRCPWRMGPHYVCMGRLETIVLPGGTTASHCPKCARREAGLCQHCNRPVRGRTRKSLYCPEHYYLEKLKARRLWGAEHMREIVAKARVKRRSNPEPSRVYARQGRLRRKRRVLHGAMAARDRRIA
jgi:hypothetical protein